MMSPTETTVGKLAVRNFRSLGGLYKADFVASRSAEYIRCMCFAGSNDHGTHETKFATASTVARLVRRCLL